MSVNKIFRICLFFIFVPFSFAVNIQTWSMDNGAKVMFVEAHQIPIVDVSVSFDAGSRRDKTNKLGVASYTASLMKSGASNLTEEAIRNQTAELAINLSVQSGLEDASLNLRSLSKPEILQPALALSNLILTKPTFNEKVLAREKERNVLWLKQAKSSPEFLLSQAMSTFNYPNHPYGYSSKVDEKNIRAVKRDDLINFHKQYYNTENAVISIVGDLTRPQAETLARNLLEGLPRGQAKQKIEDVVIKTGQKKEIAHPASQAHIMVSLPTFTRDDPDYYALIVGNYILGSGGFDSRLMKVLRDEHGLVYGVNSYFLPLEQKGEFGINFSTQKAKTNQALTLTKETLQGFIEEGPTHQELQQAKNNIVGGFPMRFDSNSKLIAYLDVIGRYNLPLDFLDEYPKKVQALTTEEIRSAWQKRIHVEDLNIVIVGGTENN